MRVETQDITHICIQNIAKEAWWAVALAVDAITIPWIGVANALVLAAAIGLTYAAWKWFATTDSKAIELKKRILIIAKPILLDEIRYRIWNDMLKNRLSASMPVAKNKEAQIQLNVIYQEYIEVVQQIQPNLRTWFELGQTFLHQIEEASTLDALQNAQCAFQKEFTSINQKHRELEIQVKRLESSLIPLLNSGKVS